MKSINDIKKALYREKPIATNKFNLGGFVYYEAVLSEIGTVTFAVPNKEADNFGSSEPAQLLIRWLYKD